MPQHQHPNSWVHVGSRLFLPYLVHSFGMHRMSFLLFVSRCRQKQQLQLGIIAVAFDWMCFGSIQWKLRWLTCCALCTAARMKLDALEEGKTGVAPPPTKAEIGSAAHLQEVENRRCVKVCKLQQTVQSSNSRRYMQVAANSMCMKPSALHLRRAVRHVR